MGFSLNLKLHHVGCLTENMQETLNHYQQTLGHEQVSEVYEIPSQQVNVAFIKTGPEFYIELVQPLGQNPTLQKLLKSNTHYYHLGYLVDHLEESIGYLQDQGYRLVNTFSSAAFQNRQCAFLYSPEMHLIELIENGVP